MIEKHTISVETEGFLCSEGCSFREDDPEDATFCKLFSQYLLIADKEFGNRRSERCIQCRLAFDSPFPGNRDAALAIAARESALVEKIAARESAAGEKQS